MGVYFSADFVSRWLRGVALAARAIERLAISVGEKLAVHRATLHRFDCFRLYRLASIHGAVSHTWHVHVRDGRTGFAKSVEFRIFRRWNPRFFFSPWRGHLEF